MTTASRTNVAKRAIFAGLLGATLGLGSVFGATVAQAEDGTSAKLQVFSTNSESLSDYEAKHVGQEGYAELKRKLLLTAKSTEDVDALSSYLSARNIEVFASGTILYQGVWVNASYADVKAALSEEGAPLVTSLADSVELAAPTLVEQPKRGRTKRDLYSNALINTNLSTYTGAGKLIAVIDSGVEPTHPLFQPLANNDLARIKSADETQALVSSQKTAPGVYLSSKIPFAYNYANNNTTMTGEHLHGTHVSGIILGNPTATNTIAQGVLPEAQLVSMKVTDAKSGTFDSSAVLRALEDAAKLKVDAINMSFGISSADNNMYYQVIIDAIEAARDKGIMVAMVSGNDGNVTGDVPISALYPDYGVPLTPSGLPTGLTVASINNSRMISRVLSVGEEKIPAGSVVNEDKAEGLYDRELEVVDVPGFGEDKDYEGLDVTGKIALVRRGGTLFSEKAATARKHGAALLIVVNYEGQQAVTMNLGSEKEMPTLSVSFEEGKKLRAAKKATLDSQEQAVEYPNAELMSPFSSWKSDANSPTVSPDITAPGGFVYSALPDGKFGLESGTSMAAPHAAAAATIIKDHAKTLLETQKAAQGTEYSETDLSTLTTQLMMSYAVPRRMNVEGQDNVLISPRKQGAGLLNVERSMAGDVVLIGDANKSSKKFTIDPDGNVSFEVQLKNYSDQTRSYSYATDLITDEVKDGKFTYKPHFEKTAEGSTVTLAAHETKTISISFNVSDILKPEAENGFFIDGFVNFTSAEPDAYGSIVLPISGFKGDFNALPVFEDSVYNLFKAGKKPLFYDVSFDDDGVLHYNFTHLSANIKKDKTTTKYVLGSVYSKEAGSESDWKLSNFSADAIAISPNSDNKYDDLVPFATILRNPRDMKAEIKDASGTVVWSNESITQYTKNFTVLDGNGEPNSGAYELVFGRMKQKLPEGEYTYRVYAPANTDPAKEPVEHEVVMPFKVDITSPEITGASYAEDTRTYTLASAKDNLAGIMRVEVTLPDGTVIRPNEAVSAGSDFETSAHTFTLPEGTELSEAQLHVVDNAYNESILPLSQTLVDENAYGIMVYRSNDAIRYHVEDAAGKSYAADELTKLTPGTYQVIVDESSLPEGYTLTGPATIEVTLSEENKLAAVHLDLREIKKIVINANIERSNYTGAIAPVLRNTKTGKTYDFKATSSASYYQARNIPVGTYVVEDTSVPAGVTVSYSPNPLTFSDADAYGRVKISYTKPKEVKVPSNNIHIDPKKTNQYAGPATFKLINTTTGAETEVSVPDTTKYFTKNMPVGVYRVELVAPAGYKLSADTPQEVNNSENGFYNSWDYALEPAEAAPETVPVSFSFGENNAYTAGPVEVTLTPDEGDATKLSVTQDGAAQVDLAPGHYTVSIENVPEGYTVSESTPKELTVAPDGAASFNVSFDAVPKKKEATVTLDTSKLGLSDDELAKVSWKLVAEDESVSLKAGENTVDLGEADAKDFKLVAEGLPEGRELSEATDEVHVSVDTPTTVAPMLKELEPETSEESIPADEGRIDVVYAATDVLSEEDFAKLSWTFTNAKGEQFKEKDGKLYKVGIGGEGEAGAKPAAFVPVARLFAAALPGATTETFSVEVEGLPEGVELAEDSSTVEVEAGKITTFTPHFARVSTPGEGETLPSEGETQPSEGEVQPGEGEIQPGEEETKPAEGQPGSKETTAEPTTASEGAATKAEMPKVKAKQVLPKTSDPAVAIPALGAMGAAAAAIAKLLRRKR